MMVDLTHYVDCNPRELGISELVYYPALVPILEQYSADPEALADAIRRSRTRADSEAYYERKISSLLSTIISILSMASATKTISTIWVTAASVRSESFCRTSIASASPDWREWFASG